MPATLTTRQTRILDFIRDYTRTVGYPPTVREIGAHAGLTATSSVHRQLEVLAAKGYLRRTGNRSRAVVVLDQADGAAA